MSAVRPPTGVLPAPESRPLPPPQPLRSMFGPGVILAGLSIGSGELVLWPRLTAEWGFALATTLAVALIDGELVAALLRGAARVGHVPEGLDMPLFLGALAFAGAGGSVNLAQSNYIKDKGYGMGRWIGRVTSPLTGHAERESVVGAVFPDDPENLARWRTWWRRTNVEHFCSFFLLCVVSLALFCLLAGALLVPGSPVSPGLEFLADEGRALETRFGPWARHGFLLTGIAVLFSTELALIDAVSRVSADLVKGSFFARRPDVTLSKLYFAIVWALVAFGIAVLVAGFDQPLVLLVLSAALNAVVMFLYAALLLWLNHRCFHGPLRPSPLRWAALAVAIVFFGFFSGLTLWDRMAGG